MTSTPDPQRVRLTISVTPEVHATFQRLSAAGGMSISRAMGEWLSDTIDAATYMAEKMEQARSAPKLVARELHSFALGLTDQTSELLDAMRKARPAADVLTGAERLPTRRPAGAGSPPSSNTGGKGHRKGRGGTV